MAIRLHGSARTTPRIRAELQLATGSHRSLAKLYGINPKTVAKWRARTSVLDEPMGPQGRASQHLSQEQDGVDPVRWTVSGLILKPSGVLCRRTMGRACRH
jgi:hypothetical protein